MMIHEKHTSRDHFTRGNLFHGGIVHMSLTSTRIALLLVVVLPGIWTISCPMASLVAIPARHTVRWNIGAALSSTTLRYSNRISLAIYLLVLTWLCLLLGWSILWSGRAELGSHIGRSFGLGHLLQKLSCDS